MPISAETAARSEHAPNDEIIDKQSYRPHDDNDALLMPSETAEPSQVSEAPQQAATQPESGSTVSSNNMQPGFKEKVIGYAKEVRGATLRKPETKEQGKRIVQGEEKFENKKVGPKT